MLSCDPASRRKLVTSVPADFANVSCDSGLGALRRTVTWMLVMALILTVPVLLVVSLLTLLVIAGLLVFSATAATPVKTED
jgi:hypothetical protein